MKLIKRENDLADFASERIEALQKKLVTVTEENEGLKNDVDIRGKKIEELRKKNENLLKDIVRHADSATALAKERDRLQDSLKAAACVNDSLHEEIRQLKARVKELEKELKAEQTWNGVTKATNEGLMAAEKDLRAQITAQEALLDQQRADCERALSERDALRKRYQEAEDRVVGFQTQLTAQEEVIERLKAQNARFVEEQREAKQRADATAAALVKAREEVARMVSLNNALVDKAKAITTEKNQIVEISNGFARERDAIQAEYDARGKVIKKLRKRLHKLKKKLKH